MNFIKRITGFSLPVIGGGLSWDNAQNEKSNTKLSLVFYGDHRTPEPIKVDNIFRWYALQHITQEIENKDNYRKNWIIFIVFDKPVNPKRLKVSFSSNQRPICEVKDFSQRSAVLLTNDEIPASTLEIEVEE